MKALISKPIEMFNDGNDQDRVIYVSRLTPTKGSALSTIVVILIASVILMITFAIGARLMKKLFT
jgi:hypothetical protein